MTEPAPGAEWTAWGHDVTTTVNAVVATDLPAKAAKALNLSDLASASAARTNLGLAAIAASGSAADLSAGTVPTGRLGSGTANSGTFLRGDQTWAAPTGYATVMDEGTARTARTTVNFVGAGVTATDDAVNGRTVVSISGGGSTTLPEINVKTDYGAVGDGSTNDTAALDSAVAAAVSSGRPLYVPKGNYKRTTPWDCRFNGLHLYGDGSDKSIIVQATSNTEGIQLGHAQQYVHDIGVTYQSAATSSHTNSNGFAFYKSAWSTYERLAANYAARSFYIPQVDYDLADGFDDGTHNWSFSCTFTDIICNKYAIGAFRMDSYIGASTGNTYRNIYTHQGNNACTEAVASWTNQTEMVCDQINLEHVIVNGGPVIALTACLSAVFHSVHVESVTMSGFDTPIFRLYDRVHLDVQSMTIQYCTVSSTGGGTKAVFQPAEGCFVHASSVQIQGNTVTGTWTGVHLDSATTSGDVYMINVDTAELSSLYAGDTMSLGRIRQFNRSTASGSFGVNVLADAVTIYADASLGDRFRVTLGGNRTLGNPTNPRDGQVVTWEIIQDGTGSRTLALDTAFALGTTITSTTLTTTAGKRDFLTAQYNSTTTKWYVTQFVKGY